MTRRRWRILVFAVMVVAVLVAIRPLRHRFEPETLFPESDKVFHTAYFFGLWFLARRAGFGAGWRLAVALVIYGVGIEVAQALTPTMRSASLADVVADSAGIALAWFVGARLERGSTVGPGQPGEDRR